MDNSKKNLGMKRLLREGRKLFRRPENLLHYDEEDFRAAERIFLKECILKDRCRM
jgi:hypothetical protein